MVSWPCLVLSKGYSWTIETSQGVSWESDLPIKSCTRNSTRAYNAHNLEQSLPASILITGGDRSVVEKHVLLRSGGSAGRMKGSKIVC